MLKQRIIKWVVISLLMLWHGTLMAIIPYKQNGNILYFGNEGKESMRIEFCNSQMIRITKSTDGNYRQNENWMVVKYDFDNVNYERDRHYPTLLKTRPVNDLPNGSR